MSNLYDPFVMVPDPDALQKVVEVHMALDTPDEPLVLSNACLDTDGFDYDNE